jgi:hypothetical protein
LVAKIFVVGPETHLAIIFLLLREGRSETIYKIDQQAIEGDFNIQIKRAIETKISPRAA